MAAPAAWNESLSHETYAGVPVLGSENGEFAFTHDRSRATAALDAYFRHTCLTTLNRFFEGRIPDLLECHLVPEERSDGTWWLHAEHSDRNAVPALHLAY